MKHLRLLIPILLILGAIPAQGQTLSGTRDKKARLERDIRTLEKQLSATRQKEGNATEQLNMVREQAAARRELLRESETELKLITDSIRLCRRRIDTVTSRLQDMTVRYERLVGNAYKHRDSRLWYMYILASDNIGQGLRRYTYLRRLSKEMNVRGREIKEERDTLEAIKARLDSLQTQARSVRDSRATEVEKLRRDEEHSRSLVARLQGDRDKFTRQISSKRKEVEALNREIERLIAAEVDKSTGGGSGKKGTGNSGGKKTSTKIDKALSDQFSANQGKLPWPAEGRVTGHFGRSQHPVYSKVEMPFNNGVNLAVEKEAPVKAVFNGTVKQIVMIPGYNQCILVQHGEYFTFYCKLASVAVKAGEKVKTGQVIGHVATINDETQLHFQLWKGKAPQDPEKWLRK